ncbi:MAG: hypothetical protein KKB30_03850 [Proteobacteria bacterium]|nr:hypothetical protein [Pseudomonadota bacterium]MBU1715651.1 hypothetical protein [Pseudomonadota bacterium]
MPFSEIISIETSQNLAPIVALTAIFILVYVIYRIKTSPTPTKPFKELAKDYVKLHKKLHQPSKVVRTKLVKLRDGTFGAILGGGSAFFIMNSVGEPSWLIILLITIYSFFVTYRTGIRILAQLSEFDKYEP